MKITAALLVAVTSLGLQACGASHAADATHGQAVITNAQCGACHVIPGVPDAHGLVGPPLTHFGQRTMIAGLLPNTPDNLVRWIQHPQAVTPGNAMPDSGLSDRAARDVAAYLDSLR